MRQAYTGRFLRHREDGTIYSWNPILANNPKCEEVSEEVAFPEKHVPKHVKKPRRKKQVDLETKAPEEDLVDSKPADTPPELAAEAARGWPQ